MKLDASVKQAYGIEAESASAETGETVQISAMEGRNARYQVIELPESVDPKLFLEEIVPEIEETIDYIQPDYQMELSAEILDMDDAKEQISENVAEEQMLENAAEIEAAQEELAAKKAVYVEAREQELQNVWEISTGEGITVAVIDTGVDITHPLLADSIVAGYNFYNDTTEVYDLDLGMEQAHGTHVAGIIAKTAPDVKIMPLKVFENGKANTSDIIAAIDYAKEHGADIVNMSFGCTKYNRALRETMVQSGMFFVCAAGNSRRDIDREPIYPAAFEIENAISVTSVNDDLGLSYFSNYGKYHVDIAAWGRDVESAWPGGDYGMMSGTSMSAAYVSAAAALVAAENDTLNLQTILKTTADQVSCLQGKAGDGCVVSFYDAVSGNTEKEPLEVCPEEDFDMYGYDPEPAESWELFSGTANVQVASSIHTAVLKEDGTVWVWGDNTYGQLGDGTTESSAAPKNIPGLNGVVQIAVGRYTTFALKSDGTVYACGYNIAYQLGDGTNTNRLVPVKINGLENITMIDATTSGIALKSDGTVWTWGQNTYGQLGNGTTTDSSVPVQVSGLTGMTQVAKGWNHCLAVNSTGNLFSWGCNNNGTLGDGTSFDQSYPVQVYSGDSIKVPDNPRIHKTIAAKDFNAIVKTDGTVWTWGYNRWGQLGIGDYSTATIPTRVYGVSNVKAVSIDEDNGMALTESGSVYAWGTNRAGQIGDGTTTIRPAPVQTLWLYDATTIACGSQRAYAIDFSKKLWNWGVSVDNLTNVLVPTEVTGEVNRFNLDFATAQEMEVGQEYESAIVTAGEYRYFSFTPMITTKYTFESISSIDMYGYLYNSAQTQLTYNDDGNGKGESSSNLDFYIEHTLVANTTYYLVARAYSSQKTGNFSVKVKYQDEYGNTFEDAYEVQEEGNLSGEITYPGDADMFKFVPRTTGWYEIQSISSLNANGTIYDAEEKQLEYNNSGQGYGVSTNANDFYMYVKLTAGESYYIKVHTTAYSMTVLSLGAYTLRITSIADDHANTYHWATQLTEGTVENGSINYGGDWDIFQFTTAEDEDGYYIIESISDINICGYLYDSSKTKITENDDGNAAGESTNTQDFYIKYQLEENKTYYLIVKAVDAAVTGNYSVKVQWKDDYKNTFEGSTVIAENQNINGQVDYAGDIDIFRFVPDETAVYIFTITNDKYASGWVYDSDRKVLSGSVKFNNENNNSYIKMTLEKGQVYYIEIFGGLSGINDTAEGPYTLCAVKSVSDSAGKILLGKGIQQKFVMDSSKMNKFYRTVIVNENNNVITSESALFVMPTSEGIYTENMTVTLSEGSYRFLLVDTNVIHKVSEIEVLDKVELPLWGGSAGADVLIPFTVESMEGISDVNFSIGYLRDDYTLMDVCSITDNEEKEVGTITAASVAITALNDSETNNANRYVVFKSTRDPETEFTGAINAVWLRAKRLVTDGAVCYAYRVVY